ncbi:MAG: helix-turn-helix transcriptional regulator [Ktedonobacteraceae bacterium]|nr:helix-turn-helix transcriptional regulator [Ktedonobacteraceae bacterium]
MKKVSDNIHPLKQERTRRNLSQQALADFSELSKWTIIRAEKGEQIGPDARKRLCQFLNKTADELGLILERTTSQEIHLTRQGTINRRDMLEMVGGASLSLLVQPQSLLTTEPWRQLSAALSRPSYIDESTLDVLESFNVNYWKLRSTVSVSELMPGMVGHLQTITQMLNSSLLPSIRKRICVIAGKLAMSLGGMNLDLKTLPAALGYYQVALNAAHESEDQSFLHVALGRLGFFYMYANEPHNTVLLLEEASHVRREHIDPSFQIWLTLVEAEANALLNNEEQCKRTLDHAKSSFIDKGISKDSYLVDIDGSTIDAYEGACYIHLGQGQQALPILQSAMAKLPSNLLPRRAMITADIAAAYALQGEVEQSLSSIQQASSIIVQTKSAMALERTQKVRSYLEPWKNVKAMRAFDEQLLLTRRA